MSSDMATAMAPKSDIAGNTGLEAMMQSNTMPSEYNDDMAMMDTEFEEEPMETASGGLIDGGPNKAATGTEVGFPRNTEVAIPKKPGMLSKLTNFSKFVPKAPTPLGLGVTGLMTAAPFLLNYFMGDKEEEEERLPGDRQDIPMAPEVDDDPVGDPDPDPTYAPSYIPQLMQQLQEDREALKEGRDQDMGLALMTAGLNIADRGQLSAGVAGVEQLAQANQAYRENLKGLSGLGVQAGVAGDTLMQKAMQARMSYDKSIELAKMLGAGDLIKGIGTIGDQLALIEQSIQLGVDENEMPLSPEKKLMLNTKKDALSEIYNMLIARTQGELGKNVIASP